MIHDESAYSLDSLAIEIVWQTKPTRVFYSTARKGQITKSIGLLKMKLANKLMLVGATLVAGISSASAAVDAGVTTAITTAGADASTVGAAVLVVIVGIFAFKLLRKAL